MRRLAVTAVVSLCAPACIDFVEPDIPERGMPAVFEARIVVTDSGRVQFDALLTPGLDLEGLRRDVLSPAIEIMDRTLRPDSIRFNGARRYIDHWSAGSEAVLAPITIRAPQVDRLATNRPAVEWFGIHRPGPDALRIDRGEDLRLPVGIVAGMPRPEPTIRQWFLRLVSGAHAVTISSTGTPPDTILVPSQWIPDGGEVRARLIYSQSVTLDDPPGDYLGLVTADTWVHWSVMVDAAAEAEARAAGLETPVERE